VKNTQNIRNNSTFGKRLRQFRKRIGLSQSDFGLKLGFSANTLISRFERDKALPTLDTILKLAELGEIDYNWLLIGKRLPDKELEQAYNKLLNRMAEHLGRNLAMCLRHREQLIVELSVQLTKKKNGEEVDEDFIEQLSLELAEFQKEITELGKDQPWLQEAILKVNESNLGKYGEDNDLKE
jgi:transcriptional regulator with XRE-family HTH domain